MAGGQPLSCCLFCKDKDEKIENLEQDVSLLQQDVIELKDQRQQHEKALRYLFEKVEALLKVDQERQQQQMLAARQTNLGQLNVNDLVGHESSFNSLSNSQQERQLQQDMRYATYSPNSSVSAQAQFIIPTQQNNRRTIHNGLMQQEILSNSSSLQGHNQAVHRASAEEANMATVSAVAHRVDIMSPDLSATVLTDPDSNQSCRSR